AKVTNYSVKSVFQAIGRLETKGYIQKTGRRDPVYKTTIYEMVDEGGGSVPAAAEGSGAAGPEGGPEDGPDDGPDDDGGPGGGLAVLEGDGLPDHCIGRACTPEGETRISPSGVITGLHPEAGLN